MSVIYLPAYLFLRLSIFVLIYYIVVICPLPVQIPENIFIELIKFTTISVEFSFDIIIYRQFDGVSMGSPLAPDLAYSFVGFHEKGLLSSSNKPVVYFR